MGGQDSEMAQRSDPHQADEVSPNPEIAERIEEALLGGPRRYTRCEVAEAAGVSIERARAVWRALGFADVDENARVFTDGDIEALRTWTMHAGAIGSGSDDKLPQVRAVGQTLSRLADWQVREIIARVGDIADPNWTEQQRASTGAELAEVLLPVVESLQSYAWRRHLVAAIGRFMSVSPDELSTTTTVVGFADIVGYTSTTRHTDIHELSVLLEAFEQNAAETIVGLGGRVVKTVGDEVLFVVDAPHDAAEIALLLSDPGRASQHLPQLRVGMALGQVLSRFGDVYGPAVNLASRLTSLARPGTALVDRELAKALREDEAFRLQPRRPAAVRGYHHLRSWSLRRSKTEAGKLGAGKIGAGETEAAVPGAMPYPAVSTHAVTGI